jgi:hypothetical protein
MDMGLFKNFKADQPVRRVPGIRFALDGAALGAGMLSSLWKPKTQLWTDGYDSVLTQAGFGRLCNWIEEFAPEIGDKIRKRKSEKMTPARCENSGTTDIRPASRFQLRYRC